MPGGDETSESIIVVSGLPRSGTSLMMNMLGAAGVELLYDDERPADDANPHGYFELQAVKGTARDASWVQRAPGCAVKVIAPLLPSLPEGYRYRVLLMERNPAEMVASQNAMLRDPGFRESGFRESGIRRESLSDERIEAIMEQKLEQARRLLCRERRFEWIPVPYATLVDDPLGQARRVADFVETPIAARAMAARVDPGLHRIRATGRA